ncbi:MAG: LPS-assembly protein LptD [Alphaproteobacteria bacterium]|nr:LPS-assembly protein LptD [Alphaproteobacteria bacterium]
MVRRALLSACLAALVLLAISAASFAAGKDEALISADSLTYDESLQLVIARGNVEIVRENRMLLADTLTYNERDDIVTASGNVMLIEPGGNVYFADFMKLEDGMKKGFIDDLSVLWTDNTRIATEHATFVDETEKRYTRVIMSPCDLCKEDPTRPPLWQLKADEVVHDEIAHDVVYHDVTLEMWGVPVFYTPYLSQADQTVDKRSGILFPSYGYDTELGYTFQVPYFWNVAPDLDFTFSPIITTKERVNLVTEYRQRFTDGLIEILGSGTYVEQTDDDNNPGDGNELRGHIEGHGQFDINNTWRWGFDLHRSTDKTYLRRYGFDSPTTLVSDAYIEGFNQRSYASGETFFFQGQRDEDEPGDTPIVVPFIQFNHVSQPTDYGARWGIDASLLNIIRTESVNTFRLALDGEWVLPHTFEDGQIVTVTASVLGEYYFGQVLDDVTMPFGPTTDVNKGRIYPQLIVDWRYPFGRRSGTTQQLIEPIVAIVVAPPDPNSSDLPNEDSQDLNFSDANLFEGNRFPGIDLLDGGQRIVYGLKAGVYGDNGGFSSVFFGQSYRFYGDTVYPTNSGLDSALSDFVGRVQIQPTDWANFVARFRLDSGDFAARVIEIDSSFYFDPFEFDIDYTFVDGVTSPTLSFDTREDLNFRTRVQIDENWRASASHRHDLANGEPLSSRVGAFYSDECFDFGAEYERRFFDDSAFSGDNRFFFSLIYKHLGEVRTSI